MNKKIWIPMIILLLGIPTLASAVPLENIESSTTVAAPSFREQQRMKKLEFQKQLKKENKAFHENLRNIKQADQAAMIKKHREDTFAKKCAFREGLHQDKMIDLRSSLADNTKLSQAQKDEILDFYEKEYQENTSYQKERYLETTAFLESIAQDQKLTPDDRKRLVRQHFAKQKQEYQKYKQEHRDRIQELRQKIHASPEPSKQDQPGTPAK